MERIEIIIAVLGKSNSGKTTFVKNLEKQYNIKTVVTCTTRPPRPGEVDGVHYHYINKEKALQLILDGEFVEHTEYEVSTGDRWIYGTRFIDIDKNKNQLIVINPKGYHKLKEVYGDKVIGIYIKTPTLTRIKRIIKRDKGNYLEALRRYRADYKDFKNLKVDITIKDFELK